MHTTKRSELHLQRSPAPFLEKFGIFGFQPLGKFEANPATTDTHTAKDG